MVNRSKKALIWTDTIASGARNLMGKQVSRSLSGATANQIKMAGTVPLVGMYKKGGTVKKTGIALVHKGELIIPASKVKSVKKKTYEKEINNKL